MTNNDERRPRVFVLVRIRQNITIINYIDVLLMKRVPAKCLRRGWVIVKNVCYKYIVKKLIASTNCTICSVHIDNAVVLVVAGAII